MSQRARFVEEQEELYQSILDQIRYLAQFEKYDQKAAVVSKGLLITKTKLTRCSPFTGCYSWHTFSHRISMKN